MQRVSYIRRLLLIPANYSRMATFQERANFIWSIADLLRGDFKQSEYGRVILPFTVLRRLDCLLEPKKPEVLKAYQSLQSQNSDVVDKILNAKSGFKFFHNHSNFNSLNDLLGEPDKIAENLQYYLNSFSQSVKEIFENFRFADQIQRLDKANLLFRVTKDFAGIDFAGVDNLEMGYIFEHLIFKFAESSNETAGEHFTPREVIKLMVHLLFAEDSEIFKEGIIKSLYDPACGTGGMLSEADEYFREHNPDKSAVLRLYGQELNPESYAICKADMMIKGQDPENIKLGNSFTEDGLENERFDYLLSNPPFGVDWKKVEKEIKAEHEKKGFGGRFGAGLPSISDGSLMFLQHMISKMLQVESGTRLAIVFNGSPLFTGSAGSGVSNIRKWIIENDLLEGIVALPDQLFYNTGISTYIWVLTNRKKPKRKGKIQLVNAVALFQKMKRSLGNKRNEISPAQIEAITQTYCAFKAGERCKIFDNEDFGYTRITVERPLLDENGKPILKKGKPQADGSLRDFENVPLKEDIEAYFRREVLPHVPALPDGQAGAWIEESKAQVGYEVNFTRYFYQYKPLRSLEEIRADILKLEAANQNSLLKAIEV